MEETTIRSSFHRGRHIVALALLCLALAIALVDGKVLGAILLSALPGLAHGLTVAVATQGCTLARKAVFVVVAGITSLGAALVGILGAAIDDNSILLILFPASVAGCFAYQFLIYLILRLPISSRTIVYGLAFTSLWLLALVVDPSSGELVWLVEPFVWWIGFSASLLLTLPSQPSAAASAISMIPSERS